jgi:hypothetical protein
MTFFSWSTPVQYSRCIYWCMLLHSVEVCDHTMVQYLRRVDLPSQRCPEITGLCSQIRPFLSPSRVASELPDMNHSNFDDATCENPSSQHWMDALRSNTIDPNRALLQFQFDRVVLAVLYDIFQQIQILLFWRMIVTLPLRCISVRVAIPSLRTWIYVRNRTCRIHMRTILKNDPFWSRLQVRPRQD